MSAEPVQELSLSYSINESAAFFRIHSYVIRWCCSPGYFAPRPLGKFCQELKLCYLDLELENPRTLSSARLVGWNLLVLWKAMRYRGRQNEYQNDSWRIKVGNF